MKQITKGRKAVCSMANELRKLGYTLSKAFKTAWERIKEEIRKKKIASIKYSDIKAFADTDAVTIDSQLEMKALVYNGIGTIRPLEKHLLYF